MPNFVFAYHGGKPPDSPEEGAKVMAAWNAWFETLGPAIVDGGAPVGASKTVASGGVSDGGGLNPLSGYSIVRADNIDGAVEMARGCPILEDGGNVEVAEAMEM